MDKETIERITNSLFAVKGANNLTAKISVLYRFAVRTKISTFKEEHIFDLRGEVKSIEHLIDKDIISNIYEAIDYFESAFIMEKMTRVIE